MKSLFYNLALLGWQALNLAVVWAAPSSHPTIVLIAFDGIPQNYIEKGHTPFLQQLAADSTTTEWMLHQFPPQMLPNLQSIATGLYPDIHGVRGDHILADNSSDCIGYGAKMYNQTNDILPIWTLNERAGGGRYSGVVAWPGFEYHWNASSPTHQIKANDTKSWENRVDDTIKWMEDDKTPANLVLLHFEANQNRTAESVPQIMQQIEDITKYYFTKLEQHGIRDKVNTIILSDHTQTNQSVGVMSENKTAQIPNNNSSCHVEIWKSLKEASKQLNAFKLTQYAKLKSNFHSTGISNEAEQYLKMKHDMLFLHPVEFLRSIGEEELNSGMFPLFIANGPLFEPKYKASPFENVDIYALISEKLNLNPPIIPINGSYEYIKNILVKDKPTYENGTFKVILYVIVALLLLACGWYIIKIRKQERVRF